MADATAPAAPLILSLTDDVGAEQGLVASGQMTDDSHPTARVSLTGSGAGAEPVQVGDTVALLEDGGRLGQATITSDDLSRGYIDVTTDGPMGAANRSLQAEVIDAAGNAGAPSAAYWADYAPADELTRVNMTDGGYVLSYTVTFSHAETHLQRYDSSGRPLGSDLANDPGASYLGQYKVTPLAAGEALYIFQEADHSMWAYGDVIDASGKVLAHVNFGGPANATAGASGGFLLSATNPFGGDGMVGSYDQSGTATSNTLELAGQITSVVAEATGAIDVNWNDSGVARTLTIDPRQHSDLANPTTAPTLTLLDDAGAQTGPVAGGGTTDDTTPTLRVSASEVGEVYVKMTHAGVTTNLGAYTLSADDVARGYRDIPTNAPQDGTYIYAARTSDSSGLASPWASTSLTEQSASPSGQTLQGQSGGSQLTGGAGDDTLVGGTGPDVMTGAGGADHFAFQAAPWSAAEITDFTRGTDKLDLSGLLSAAHYTGSDPIADGYVKLIDDGHGDSWLYFDSDGRGTADPWGTFVATLDNVSAGSITSADLTTGGPASPPPPPPSNAGQTLQAQPGGSNLSGGAGDDTLIGGSGPDTLTGAGGADHFVYQSLPWQAGEITDFTHGTDKIDLSGLLASAHYAGADPIADGYVKLLDDGHGNTWLYFDSDGRGTADPWGSFVATLNGVAPASFSAGDFIM